MNEIFDWEQVPEQENPPLPFNVQQENPLPYDEDCSIFPPSSHEGLHVEGSRPEPETAPAKPSSSKGNATERLLQLSVSRLRVSGGFAKHRVLLGLEVLYSKLLLRFNALNFFAGRAIWSFASAAAAGVAGMLVLLWLRRRQLALAKKKDVSILLLIREQDQKINQLFHQIAQMKEILSTQRNVPVLRSA